MVMIMDHPWFRRLFSRVRTVPVESMQTKANNGDPEAQFNLGSSYADLAGTTPNDTQAVEWFLKAANQDHALAQFSLGLMLADGRGAARDNAQALQWIFKAAQQGHAGAQYHLGLICRRASLDRKNPLESSLEAYKWLRLAAEQGFAGSEAAFETVALAMTREEVLQANQRAANFVVTRPKPIQL